MKKLLRIVTFFTFAVTALLGLSAVAEAESLPPGFLVGDDTGFQAGSNGEYFIVNDNIHPGQTFTREITLSNYSKKDGSFDINLVMNPEDDEHVAKTSGAVDLLKAVSVTLTYEGAVIYEGPIDGSGKPVANNRATPINLGTLEIGEVRNITADFVVSSDYSEADWEDVSSADFYWLFFVNRETTGTTDTTIDSTTEPTVDSTTQPSNSSSTAPPTSSEPPAGKLPQTGEDWRNVLLGMIAGFALITVALIIARKRHSDQKQ